MECHKGSEIEHCSFRTQDMQMCSNVLHRQSRWQVLDLRLRNCLLIPGNWSKTQGFWMDVFSQGQNQNIPTYSNIFKPNILKHIHNKLRLWRTQGIIHSTKHVSKLLTHGTWYAKVAASPLPGPDLLRLGCPRWTLYSCQLHQGIDSPCGYAPCNLVVSLHGGFMVISFGISTRPLTETTRIITFCVKDPQTFNPSMLLLGGEICFSNFQKFLGI